MKTLAVLAILLASWALTGSAQNPASPAAPPHATLAKKSWFVRLNPPRPTFAQDRTAQEKKLMDQHYAYWKARFDQGVCVFGGPVLDPKGAYGVLALRAESADVAQSIAAHDPAVQAGLLHPEVSEMSIAFPPTFASQDTNP